MYKVKIKGVFRGNFKTAAEAMQYVEKHAMPWKNSWEILDKFNKVYAKS